MATTIISDYIVLFFVFCFIGWIWECCYCSVKAKRVINRGFVHGPCLPIYGSGGLLIIIVTSPVQDNTLLVFLIGMLACTILEYFTGAAMLAIFKVRYWDYSNQRFNLNGHIYWAGSLLWGTASIALMRFVYPPLFSLVASIPDILIDIIALVCLVTFTIDLTVSVREALDLRTLLQQISENNHILESVVDKLGTISENITKSTSEAKALIASIQSELNEIKSTAYENVSNYLPKSASLFADSVKARSMSIVDSFEERVSAIQSKIVSVKSQETDKFRKELSDLKVSLTSVKRKTMEISNKELHEIHSILKRNPMATSSKYKDAIEMLRSMIKKESGSK